MCFSRRTGVATILIVYMCLMGPGPVQAVERAPRISDREIIESLVELKGRIDHLEVKIDERFDAVNQRFESIDKQFGRLWGLMLVLIAGIFGLIGFIVWDRRTMLRPLEQRLDRLEGYLEHDLEIKHEDGSRTTRLIKVLREMAREDEKLAAVLKSFSLL